MNTLKLIPPLKNKLERLENPPSSLAYDGIDLNDISDRPFIAVVGTRKPTPYGKYVTNKLVTELASKGAVIVSGLAFGVDILAHKAAIDAGGITIAVLPSGLSNIYPASHRGVADRIREKGALISEYADDHHPRKVEFLERNRIIAALSDAVIIPEAAEKSGSLNTAQHATKMGIPLFAVPGQIHSTMSQGTHYLIKSKKAEIITSMDDLLSVITLPDIPSHKQTSMYSQEEQKIIDTIASGVHDQTLIQQESGLETNSFQTTMTMLEIKGLITQDSIGRWRL